MITRERYLVRSILIFLLFVRIIPAIVINIHSDTGFLNAGFLDPFYYLRGAQSILSSGVNEFGFFPPLNFFFIAGFLCLGSGKIIFPLLAATLVEWMTIIVLYLLARTVFDKKTALITVLLAGLYPNFIYQGFTFYAEALTLFWIVLFYLMIARYTVASSYFYLFFAGFFWGLASQTRGGLYCFALVVSCIIYINHCMNRNKNRLLSSAIFLTVMFITFFAVGILVKPFYTDNGFSLNSKNGMAALIIGANPISTSSEDYGNIRGNLYYDIGMCDEWPDDVLQVPKNIMSFSTVDIVRMLAENIRYYPLLYIKNAILKLSSFWAPNGNSIHLVKTKMYYDYSMLTQILCVIISIFYACIICGGLCGLAISREPAKYIFISFIIYYSALIFVTVGNARLRLPLMPFFFMYCAYFINRITIHPPCWKLLPAKKTVFALIVLFFFNFAYKYGEIMLDPGEVRVRKVEKSLDLGFPKTADYLMKKYSTYNHFSERQKERLQDAARRLQ